MKPTQPRLNKSKTRECLLGLGNSEFKEGLAKREGGEIDWEASTLPLSYTR